MTVNMAWEYSSEPAAARHTTTQYILRLYFDIFKHPLGPEVKALAPKRYLMSCITLYISGYLGLLGGRR